VGKKEGKSNTFVENQKKKLLEKKTVNKEQKANLAEKLCSNFVSRQNKDT